MQWLVGSIKDPEKRECTLEDLNVINKDSVTIRQLVRLGKQEGRAFHEPGPRKDIKIIEVKLKPTNAHCHLIQQIALAVHLRLKRELPFFGQYKLRVICFPESHAKQEEVEKQMNDKERIAAAF